ncbi:MAG: hypothetical protein HY902_09250 [Deltaproteobacteria bacterium]|nr:hypothetical protein [Deltaproteobacteria bacterium]
MLASLAALSVLASARPACAFDYLEHMWLGDRACRDAQFRLAQALRPGDDRLAARFLALAVACPSEPVGRRAYCVGGYKQATAQLNHVETSDYPATFGDFAALPDHISDFGPIAGLTQAAQRGLVAWLWRWLAAPVGDAGGVVGDVGEDACETNDLVDWEQLEDDVNRRLSQWRDAPGDVTPSLLEATARAPAVRGPHDAPGPYSFDNPHYLDLVLRNHDHFGGEAWRNWTGFHSVAQAVAARPCRDSLALSPGDLRALAVGNVRFQQVNWTELDSRVRRQLGCQLQGELAAQRVALWARSTDPTLARAAQPWLAQLSEPEGEPLRQAIAAALASLSLEGAGLHFLQDGLSGGHLRTLRAGRSLEDSRYDHDTDGQAGLASTLVTRAGPRRLVAFGDGWLLGRSGRCGDLDLEQPASAGEPKRLTACLLQHQRALLVGMGSASLVDWALGGALDKPDPAICKATPLAHFACNFLPLAPPQAGAWAVAPHSPVLPRGDLPVPPPPFTYESLLTALAIDGAGNATQVGVRMEFLSQLGSTGHWLRSWDVGLLTRLQPRHGPDLALEAAHLFHFRWAARFLVHAGPVTTMSLYGFGEDVGLRWGLGGAAGLTLLPEGWTKLPLELRLSYRIPVILFDSQYGFDRRSIDVPAQWIEFAFGVAFL